VGTENTSWKRLAAEGTAVLFSILLAFSIDAAWQQRQERESDLIHLQGLLEELHSHKVLLGEAITAHRRTVERGYELLELLSPEPDAEATVRMTDAIHGLLNYYRINVPFGSLQTAISSGAIARMSDVELASALASWPTSIEDLLEEEDNGGTVVAYDFFVHLGEKVVLADVYERRLLMPTVRGTEEVVAEVAVRKLPDAPYATDYSVLYGDIAFANELLYFVMLAQSSHGEAIFASEKLAGLLARLDTCLLERRC